MSNKTYVYPAKTLSQSRNKFKMPHQHKTSFNHGLLIPLDVIEVLPGDTFKMDLATLIRMSTPIAPIMDNITMHIAAYFVPNRLTFENWEQLMGANKTGAWTQDPNTYDVPTCSMSGILNEDAIGCYMGLPGNVAGAISALPGRAYYLIWNEFYRNQNVSAPYAVDLSDSGDILVGELSPAYTSQCLPLGKYADYFTKCLPEPQKGSDVLIPMNNLLVGLNPTNQNFDTMGLGDDLEVTYNYSKNKFGVSDGVDVPSDLIANNVSNTINALRFAFQLQKFYEKDARYGTRYFEMLNGHFGVTNPDGVLQRPQFLGEYNFRINVDQVLSTAGYAASSSTTVGAPGANSVTAKKGSLFTFSATEHGLILIVGGTRHEHTYSQGWHRLFTRLDRLEFYDPVFANIGEQPVYKYELKYTPGDGRQQVFGYQEAWAEYRFIPDRVSGLLNPNVTGSLDYWTLADKFTSTPSLNETFIYENRNSIKRALVTGNSGPDFIADFYFDLTAVREMPLFSIPGLADHH